MSKHLLHGLYAITDSTLITPEAMISAVGMAIQGGARAIQYRDKSSDQARRQWEANDLINVCRSLHVPLIINDDVELAASIGADGIHLGQDDADLQAARTQMGEHAIIGISCYNSLERAIEAETVGADYVAFGRFFPSATKPDAIQASPELLTQAKARLQIPVVAIGGITPDNGGSLVTAGADALAVIHGVFGQQDITAAAARYADLFHQETT